jgi:hypothetical protein
MTIRLVGQRPTRWPVATVCTLCSAAIPPLSAAVQWDYEDDDRDLIDDRGEPEWWGAMLHPECAALLTAAPGIPWDGDKPPRDDDHYTLRRDQARAYLDAHDDPDGLLARIEDEGHREALRSRYADLMHHRGQLTLLPKEPTP